jgi:transcriptional regulator with XRE-family HTH domain
MPDRTNGGRDELSRALRELRQAAGLSGKEAAEAAGIYPSKISRIELGRSVPSEEDVGLLARIYRAPPEQRARLREMASDLKEENRRVVFNRDAGVIQERFERIEQRSALVRTFAPNLVPALLRSPDYVRALLRSRDGSARSVEAGVAAELERQRILDDRLSARRFILLTTEGALGWAPGPPELMIEQVERIIAATHRRNSRVGVVPFGRPSAVFPPHGWDLYDHRAVIVSTETATALLTEPRDVDAYVALTDQVERLAAYDEEARAVLTGVIKRYRALDA